MFRNSSRGSRAVRIASLLLAALFIVAVGTPLEAKGVTKFSKRSRPSDELQFSDEAVPESPGKTFTVQSWIPGFDDDESVFTCVPIYTPNLLETKFSNHSRLRKAADYEDGCGIMLRMLPWNFQSIQVGSDEIFRPII